MNNIYLNTKVIVNSRKIEVMIIGDKKSIQAEPFVLFIPGGPGCSYRFILPSLKKIIEHAKVENSTPPNFILFDPLGCGGSDDALDKPKEYTVDNFNEIAAQVVEQVKIKLNLKQMDLRVWGRSFGAMTAMCLPNTRPKWLNSESDIRLQQIIPESFIDSWETYLHHIELVDALFKDHPKYKALRKYAEETEKSFKEKFDDKKPAWDDVDTLLYSKEAEQVLDSFAAKIYSVFPRLVTGIFDLISYVYYSDDLDAMRAILHFNNELAMTFMKNKYDNVHVSDLVKKNLELYSSIPVCFISGEQDVITNPKYNAELIQKDCPNMGGIVFNSRHDIDADIPEYTKVIHDLLVNSRIDQNYLLRLSIQTNKDNLPPIKRTSLPDEFLEKLKALDSMDSVDSSAQTMKKMFGNNLRPLSFKEEITVAVTTQDKSILEQEIITTNLTTEANFLNLK